MASRDTGSVFGGNFKYVIEAAIGNSIVDSGQRALQSRYVYRAFHAGLGSQDLGIYLDDAFKWKEDQFHYMSASF
ncbi:hypothetical protein [Pseudomonas fulva]|uniref:hypothetical protein n=1 Tax=Pseudomonas fulva TaxID=47880 RepID=UPI001E48A9DF|nr:hypothetical protein [Pseudomonas fulva]